MGAFPIWSMLFTNHRANIRPRCSGSCHDDAGSASWYMASTGPQDVLCTTTGAQDDEYCRHCKMWDAGSQITITRTNHDTWSEIHLHRIIFGLVVQYCAIKERAGWHHRALTLHRSVYGHPRAQDDIYTRKQDAKVDRVHL